MVSRKTRIAVTAGVVYGILMLGGYLFVNHGNPQWHWRLYVHQAKNRGTEFLEPGRGYTGEWKNWRPDGSVASVYRYDNGKREGAYTVHTPSGGVLSKGQYKNGELDGTQVFFQEGFRVETPYADGKRNGVQKTWYPDGELRTEAPWVDGVEDGPVTFYFPNGSVESVIPFYRGKREGPMQTWHPNGIRGSLEYFSEDKKNGASSFWREDGNPDMTLSYWNDQLDGVQTWFYPDGSKSRESEWMMGVPHGEWKEWDENGKLIVDEYYEKGELKKKPEPKSGERTNPETVAGTAEIGTSPPPPAPEKE